LQNLKTIHIFKIIFHRTPINYLLVNLAVADMVVATFFAPMHIFVHTFTHPDGFIGTLLCKFLTGGAFAWTGGASSVFTLVAISVERYYAVNYPHGNKGKLTHNKLKVRLSYEIVWFPYRCQVKKSRHLHLGRVALSAKRLVSIRAMHKIKAT